MVLCRGTLGEELKKINYKTYIIACCAVFFCLRKIGFFGLGNFCGMTLHVFALTGAFFVHASEVESSIIWVHFEERRKKIRVKCLFLYTH